MYTTERVPALIGQTNLESPKICKLTFMLTSLIRALIAKRAIVETLKRRADIILTTPDAVPDCRN